MWGHDWLWRAISELSWSQRWRPGATMGMTASDCFYVNAGASFLQSFPNKRLALTFAVQLHSLNSDLNTTKAGFGGSISTSSGRSTHTMLWNRKNKTNWRQFNFSCCCCVSWQPPGPFGGKYIYIYIYIHVHLNIHRHIDTLHCITLHDITLQYATLQYITLRCSTCHINHDVHHIQYIHCIHYKNYITYACMQHTLHKWNTTWCTLHS